MEEFDKIQKDASSFGKKYYQQNMHTYGISHGATKEGNYFSGLSSNEKLFILGAAAIVLAASSAGCTSADEIRNNEHSVILGQKNMSDGRNISLVYRCGGGMVKGDLYLIMGNGYEALGHDFFENDKIYSDLEKEFCFGGYPKEIVLKKLSQSF